MSGARGRGFCHPAEVQSDGRVLPDLREAYVLYRLGFVRTDDLPDLAARWLAAGLVDNESFRLLAGHDPHDPAMLDMLIADSVSEADVTIPSESTRLQEIAIDWVTSTWRHTGDTRWAISTLAQRGETYPEFGLRPSSERSETRVPEPPAFPAREPNGSKRWSAARERSTARSPSWIRRWQCRVGGAELPVPLQAVAAEGSAFALLGGRLEPDVSDSADDLALYGDLPVEVLPRLDGLFRSRRLGWALFDGRCAVPHRRTCRVACRGWAFCR
jgi:hypothetical protein